MDQRDILKDDLLLISERTEEFIKDSIGCLMERSKRKDLDKFII